MYYLCVCVAYFVPYSPFWHTHSHTLSVLMNGHLWHMGYGYGGICNKNRLPLGVQGRAYIYKKKQKTGLHFTLAIKQRKQLGQRSSSKRHAAWCWSTFSLLNAQFDEDCNQRSASCRHAQHELVKSYTIFMLCKPINERATSIAE